MSIQASLNSITSSALSITKTAVGAVTDTDEKAENLLSNERKESVGSTTTNATTALTSQNSALENARKAQEYTEGKKMQKRLARNPKLVANPYNHLEVMK